MFRDLIQRFRRGDAAAAEVSEELHEERVEVGTSGQPGIMPDGDVPDWSSDEEAPPGEAP